MSSDMAAVQMAVPAAVTTSTAAAAAAAAAALSEMRSFNQADIYL